MEYLTVLLSFINYFLTNSSGDFDHDHHLIFISRLIKSQISY